LTKRQKIYKPNRHQGEKSKIVKILTHRGSFDRLQWLHCQFNWLCWKPETLKSWTLIEMGS